MMIIAESSRIKERTEKALNLIINTYQSIYLYQSNLSIYLSICVFCSLNKTRKYFDSSILA